MVSEITVTKSNEDLSRIRTVRFGPRSFRVSAPTVWNSLPDSLRSEDTSREQFKRLLKTVLFERAHL